MNEQPRLVNRHPVDRLAEVRETIRLLKLTEVDLVNEVSAAMGDDDSLGGDEYIARQKVSMRKGSIDQKRMEAAGIDVESYRKPETTVFSIRVEKREMEAV